MPDTKAFGPDDSGIMAAASVRLSPPRAAGREARTSDFVRVRLLIAIPVMIVLLLVIMGGVIYQFVEIYFGASQLTRQDPRVLQDFAKVFLLILGTFALAGALVGTYLGYSITRPIRQIVRLSAKVGRGDFSSKAQVVRRDEFGELGSSFNQMVESLSTFISSRNRYILESFSGGLVTTDTAGVVVAINSAAEKMLGIRAADAVGQQAAELFSRSETAQLGELIQEVLRKEEPVLGRRLEIVADGASHMLSANCSPMRDEAGRMFGLIINFRELAEMQRFYEQMNRADRLATLGTFAAGLAHEVRNPLGAIKGTAQLLAEDVRANPRAFEYTQVIVKEVNRLDRLVREVQEFSSPSPTEGRETDLTVLTRDTVALARNRPSETLGADVRIVERYADLPTTVVSAEKLVQALLNILLNALQATPAGGEIEVATEYLPDSQLPLRITVSNTGSSISPEQLTRIFEPFYTTKEKGSGLGLSIAYQVMRRHGGELAVASANDRVTFELKLPQNDAQSCKARDL